MNSPLADFLTFISPICILVLFFLCFFRFLFRSCRCFSSDEHREDSSCSSGLPSSEERPGVDWMRSLIGAGGPQIHPVNVGHPFSATDVVFIPPHILEDPFPPKYEDAIKMPSPNAEVANTPRRQSITTIQTRTPAASPPPIYEEQSTPRENEHANEPTEELPPNYPSPNLSAALSRHRNSLTIENRPAPNFSATRRYRRSLGDAYLDIIPEHELRATAPESAGNSLTAHPFTSSAQPSRPSSSTNRPGTSSRTPSPQDKHITIEEPPRRVSIDIEGGYEAPLPGEVAEEHSDSPMMGVRRNSVRRPSCLTVSDLNVQTL